MTGSAEEGWDEWSARFHGPQWQVFKAVYWSTWWTRKRCFWCRGRRRLELNHLVYPRHRELRLTDVQPLCRRCHRAETAISRLRRPPAGGDRVDAGALLDPLQGQAALQ